MMDTTLILKKLKRMFFSKLDFYFYEELIPNYVFGLLIFTFLMLLNQLFYLIRLYTVYNVPLNQVFLLLMNLIPFILTYTMPFSILPSVLITMGRLSADSEIIAMKSCGISTIKIMLPGIAFGIFITIFSFFFNEKIVIRANEIYVKLNAKIIAQKPAVELKEKSFLELGNYKISFERLSYDGNIEVLHNISVVDLKGRKTIQAQMGRIFLDPENPEHYILKFMNGSISEVTKTKNPTEPNSKEEEKFFVASFKHLTLHAYVTLDSEYYSKGPDMMSIKELSEEVKNRSKVNIEKIESFLSDRQRVVKEIENLKKQLNVETKGLSKEEIEKKLKEFEGKIGNLKKELIMIEKSIENYRNGLPRYQLMKLYEKFALPLASLSFVILALSFGMFLPKTGRNEGLGISLILTLVFFAMKVGSENLIMKGILPVFFEWVPTLVYFLAGMILFILKIRE
jgi:lipopolysaccharide export LptBFGC system permease protein LptF